MPFLIVHLYALSVKHFSVIQLWNFSDKTNKIVYFLASFLLIAYFPGKLIILRVRSFWNSEGFREILRYDKKKKIEMPYVGYEQVLSVENLYISLKIIQKPFQRETFGINF